jgi:hypothetical protein
VPILGAKRHTPNQQVSDMSPTGTFASDDTPPGNASATADTSPFDDSTPNDPGVRGRPFTKGNPGRRPGSKNRNTLILRELLEDEEGDLIRKAIEIAKGGDVPMLKFLLSRMLPRERPIKVDLPRMEYADDAVAALGSVTQSVTEGNISPSEGAALATLINSYARAIDIADAVKRIDALENKLEGGASL